MKPKVPMSSPDLTDAERTAVLEVLNTPVLSMGHWLADFESAFVERTGRAHAIGGTQTRKTVQIYIARIHKTVACPYRR